jgi:hypothetical protein
MQRPTRARSRRFVCSGIALAILALPALAGTAPEIAPAGWARSQELVAAGVVPLERAPAVDRAAAALEDEERERAGLPYRFAMANTVSITPDAHGLWERTGDGREVWRLRVASADALSLNLGFTRYRMPEGGQLYLYALDGSRWLRAFTAEDNAAHGELWTPVLRAAEIIVEVNLPAGTRDELQLHLGAINVGYRGLGAEKGGGESGACNIDVVCPLGDGWRSEIPSVARITIAGTYLCTGFMVNNTALDMTPYFMTAYHCGLRSSNSGSLVAYWNYETSTCGGVPDGSLADSQTGSFFRAQYSASDMTLVVLDSDPQPEWGVTFAGWDRSGAEASTAVAIHHPQGDEKRISFEYDTTSTTSYLGTTSPGDGTHVRVADWDEGTTEGGSSGSPLFDQDHRVIGQLHGGYAACGNNSADWYGRLSVSWTGGGSSSSRLSDWLDPGGTGAMAVGTLDPNNACTDDPDCDDGLFCNGAETCDTGLCMPGSDPCPDQGCDEDLDECVPLVCDNDGTCESGEDCHDCPGDCISGSSSASCGNGVCEIGAGEDCISCSQDCNGKLGGKPSGRYCCGDGAGTNPVGCGDPRCTGSGNTCSTGAGEPYCCGDGTCGGAETASNCAVDCDPGGGGECLPQGEVCSSNGDCCSNLCKGRAGTKTCQ